ncbi:MULTISPECIES: hypothetical protein [unclassified Microcoleus]|uniref:hypothetical protein n=1 Tax=unclassified Microcoleus TaxID=2642155 RepID=UPI002FD5BF90
MIAPSTPPDRPWQEFQQTETFAIANQLSQQIKMIYWPITQPTIEVRSLLPEYQTLFSMMVERSIPQIQLLILSNSDRYFCPIQSKCRPNVIFC